MTRDLPVHPGCCAVCRRIEGGVGFTHDTWRPRPDQVIWVCLEHLDLAEPLYRMPIDTLNRFEVEALWAGLTFAGDFLVDLGTTDLGLLSRDQQITFAATLLDGYGRELAALLQTNGRKF